MKMNLWLITLILGLMVSCGDKNDSNEETVQCSNAETFEIVNMSDLDGCEWMLTSTNYDFRLQPINIYDFVTSPEHGQMINIEFEFRDDMGGICMAGRIVEISCIRD